MDNISNSRDSCCTEFWYSWIAVIKLRIVINNLQVPCIFLWYSRSPFFHNFLSFNRVWRLFLLRFYLSLFFLLHLLLHKIINHLFLKKTGGLKQLISLIYFIVFIFSLYFINAVHIFLFTKLQNKWKWWFIYFLFPPLIHGKKVMRIKAWFL